ncbi:sensor histidine kinase [Novisyntrophococcus fermenticellae]|uniref:sensor histidine kinase n=1 Tax=Novisyntrophococcus fermenticellae TaxID=2068655 RepID=UPI001E2A4641|nr:sensor histidine kinase [Novisyntrophococcus fermenticellae]
MDKKKMIEKGYLSVVYSQMEETQEALDVLALAAENSYSVKWSMSGGWFDTVEKKKYALNAQKTMWFSLEGSNVKKYVDDMLLVNRSGLCISIKSVEDFIPVERVFASAIFAEKNDASKAKICLAESVVDKGTVKLVYAYPLDRSDNNYIYMELNTNMFVDFLEPYKDSANVIITDRNQKEWGWYSSKECQKIYEEKVKTIRWQLNSMAYMPFGLDLNVMSENSMYSQDVAHIISVIFVTLILVICIGVTVSRMVSTRITQPLQRLSRHIGGMTDQTKLKTDLSIEEGEDEVADIGKAFNMLVRHINELMKKQKEMYEQKQRLEMNALQAQINPHFLYNTLDSIRWMAVFQKADNIADTVMSLEDLLRNMAKGVGDKITLREELSLVADYVKLQQVRYMEIFDYICDIPEKYMDYLIVKMSMQPLIENAILHGIVPNGTYGEVRVSANETETELYITVEDNGIGIDKEVFIKVVTAKNKNAMSGVGIVNVDERIRMTYGEEYGLIYEGEKGKFARVTIHIPKEWEER